MDHSYTNLIGRLGRDPELRYLPSNTGVCSFSVAVSDRWKDKDGKPQERTNWIDVEVFGPLAERVNQYLAKGSRVFCEGRLRMDSWDDRDGKTRSKLKVVATNVIFLDPKGSNAEGGSQHTPSHQPAASYDDVPFAPLMPEDV